MVQYSVFRGGSRRITGSESAVPSCGRVQSFSYWSQSVVVLSLRVMISFQICDGIELLDWLFDQNDGILRHMETGHHGNHHTWPTQDTNVCETAGFLILLQCATESYCTFLFSRAL